MAKVAPPLEIKVHARLGVWRKEGRTILNIYEPDEILARLKSDGACAQAKNAGIEFFPSTGESQSVPTRICRTQCYFLRECLVYAIENGENFGIWGGATISDRQRLRRKIGRDPGRKEEIISDAIQEWRNRLGKGV